MASTSRKLRAREPSITFAEHKETLFRLMATLGTFTAHELERAFVDEVPGDKTQIKFVVTAAILSLKQNQRGCFTITGEGMIGRTMPRYNIHPESDFSKRYKPKDLNNP